MLGQSWWQSWGADDECADNAVHVTHGLHYHGHAVSVCRVMESQVFKSVVQEGADSKTIKCFKRVEIMVTP